MTASFNRTIAGRIDQFCLGMIAARCYLEKGWSNLRAVWFPPAAVMAFLMLWQFNRAGGFPLRFVFARARPLA